eukprot:COSAG05_NODE_12400_length_469_cov_1.124324_1_plen_66_part_10
MNISEKSAGKRLEPRWLLFVCLLIGCLLTRAFHASIWKCVGEPERGGPSIHWYLASRRLTSISNTS